MIYCLSRVKGRGSRGEGQGSRGESREARVKGRESRGALRGLEARVEGREVILSYHISLLIFVCLAVANKNHKWFRVQGS